MTNEMWRAIEACDAAYDGKFFYGVRTTGIFCRPSCKSRTPLQEHVRIFSSTDAALADQYRPCKRCKPGGLKLPDEEWVDAIAAIMEARYAEQLTLAKLAELSHASPYHMQRMFKRLKGASPAAYLQRVRIEAAKRLLRSSESPISEIGSQVGYPNAAHFATVFQKESGCSPTTYRMAVRNDTEGVEGT
ncbi:bifunctional transcriptional activator/DNA repair enzyme AdaA [Paenibacillus montanisoli]|uniref:AraC family transcriptional regulator n=1 Tax=Paenibacillus montanisoli TaxID=2081970 RepID=A0A328U6I2_9BACL|nr:Ada metal-binding domain-containing protein [Paenibacillus montanisoli]RAP78317.1 AraC family transcriptional regulator [Paenibacillus montanisoli]